MRFVQFLFFKHALVRQMMEKEGITEEMKACDQMEWVRAVNNIRNVAEEIVLKELVYI